MQIYKNGQMNPSYLHIRVSSVLETKRTFLSIKSTESLSHYRGQTRFTRINWTAVTYGWVGCITLHWPILWLKVNWFLCHVQDLGV